MVARLPPELRAFSRVPTSLSSALRIGSRSRPGARLPASSSELSARSRVPCEPRVAPGSKRGSPRVPDRAPRPLRSSWAPVASRILSPRGAALGLPAFPRLLPAALWVSSPLRPPCGSCLRGDPQVLPPSRFFGRLADPAVALRIRPFGNPRPACAPLSSFQPSCGFVALPVALWARLSSGPPVPSRPAKPTPGSFGRLEGFGIGENSGPAIPCAPRRSVSRETLDLFSHHLRGLGMTCLSAGLVLRLLLRLGRSGVPRENRSNLLLRKTARKNGQKARFVDSPRWRGVMPKDKTPGRGKWVCSG